MRTIASRALGASTNLAVYLEAEAIRWRKDGRRRPARDTGAVNPNREPEP